MKLCLRGVLAASLLCLVGTQQNNTICKPAFSCKALEDCPNALKELKEGKNLITCGLEGTTPQFCCKPSVGEKSKEMCKRYADAVYIHIPDPYAEGFIDYDTCALVEPLIINGINAQPMEYPHMASIGYGSKDDIKWYCGGSLISERYVLSLARCNTAGEYGLAKWVRLGDYNTESSEDENLGLSEVKIYDIVQRILHPEYKTEEVYKDIALYKLDKIVIFNQYIRPICLQTEFEFNKTFAIATGWGRTEWGGKTSDVLQKGNLTISSRQECTDAFKDVLNPLKNGINHETMLCAGNVVLGTNTCQGDSGGPLQIRLKEPYCMYSLVGITSLGKKCGGPDPSIYTRVSTFVPWIESIVWP